jgi:protein-tyrosine phosphatase
VSSWLNERSRNGGVDEVPLPRGPGRLWLCGKHFIGPDVEVALAQVGASTVVCLTERRELSDRYPDYVDWLRTAPPTHAVWHPIHDMHVPPLHTAAALVDDLVARLDRGEVLLVHCAAGIGRSGTIAVAILLAMGVDLDAALTTVAASRPMAGPEAGVQSDLLRALAATYRSPPETQ